MQEKIKQLYVQSIKDGDDALQLLHSHLFDIEAFAQRIVFRCAMAARIAQTEGRDAYVEIMEKFGADVGQAPTELGGHTLHPLGTEIPLVADDSISSELNETLVSKFGSGKPWNA